MSHKIEPLSEEIKTASNKLRVCETTCAIYEAENTRLEEENFILKQSINNLEIEIKELWERKA